MRPVWPNTLACTFIVSSTSTRERGIAQLAGVTDLAAALGVERRVVEHDHGVVAGTHALHRRAVDVQRRHLAVFAHQVFVAVEGGRRAIVVEALRHLELAGGARLFALAVHRRFERRAESTVTPRSRQTSAVRSSGKP